MNKLVCLGLSVLDFSKTVIYEFWYDYVKPNNGKNAKLCSLDTGSFIVRVKTDDIFKGIVEDVVTRFDPANFELDRPNGKLDRSNFELDSLKGRIKK